VNEITPIRPSQTYYWLAAPFLIIGISIFAYTLIHGLMRITDGLTQVVVPGSVELNFKKGLTYTIFFEQHSVVNGKIYSIHESVDGLTCRVKSVTSNAFIGLRSPRVSTSYNLGSRSGRSVLEFTIPEDGAYQFTCDYAEGSHGPEAVLAVGSGVGKKIVQMILNCFVAMFGGGGIAVAVILSVFFMRERAKKRLMFPT